MMTMEQLREIFERSYRVVKAERAMRAKVFTEGHPSRAGKLAEMDQLLNDLVVLKDLAKVTLNEPVQGRMFEERVVGSEKKRM